MGDKAWGFIVGAVIALAFFVPIIVGGANCSGTQTVTVASGDTVWSLAYSHVNYPAELKGEVMDAINGMNSGLNPNVIKPGERLNLPLNCS